jgi:uncharacterized protein (TIGR02118 family)
MLKIIMCVKRLGHLSREAFDEHWRDRHGPLVARHAGLLGIRRYIQTVPLADTAAQMALQAGRGTLPVDFDGCAELWWDDLPSHLAARSSTEGLAALRALVEDERRFVDLDRSLLWYGWERVIL